MAQWASVGRNLITRPTGVAGCVIMARLENVSGSALRSLGIAYDLLVQNAVTEEVQGHLVYYSMTGEANSWRQIPGISASGTSGRKSATLDLNATPWAEGTLMYVLWADDNGSGTPDSANQIDNFTVSVSRPSLSIAYSAPNVTITWPAGSGILQFKTSLTQPLWMDVPGAGSSGSAMLPADGPHKFFTLRAP
jgi:hypothetical protein